MKRIYVLILLCFLKISSFSQTTNLPVDSITKKVSYSAIVEVPGDKSKLFDRAIQWFALSFKSSNDVIQIKDKEAGKIVASFTAYSSEAGPVSANIIVLLKDNKYKYTITDLVFNGSRKFKPWTFEEDPNPWSVGLMKKGIRYIRENTIIRVEGLIVSLKNTMSKPLTDDF